jgi:hypothetical protein
LAIGSIKKVISDFSGISSLTVRLPFHDVAQQRVHADGWIRTAKLAFFVALGFVRFVGESRPSSRP